MAVNILQGQLGVPLKSIQVPVTNTTTNPTGGAAASGDVCLWNKIAGIAQEATDATTGLTVLDISCIAEIQVNAVNAGGNSNVVSGDTLYFNSGDAIPVSKKTAGVSIGQAYGSSILNGGTDTTAGTLIAGGANATIRAMIGKSSS